MIATKALCASSNDLLKYQDTNTQLLQRGNTVKSSKPAIVSIMRALQCFLITDSHIETYAKKLDVPTKRWQYKIRATKEEAILYESVQPVLYVLYLLNDGGGGTYAPPPNFFCLEYLD